MTGEDLLEYVVGKAMLDRDVFWGVFEIVGHGQMGKEDAELLAMSPCRCDDQPGKLGCHWLHLDLLVSKFCASETRDTRFFDPQRFLLGGRCLYWSLDELVSALACSVCLAGGEVSRIQMYSLMHSASSSVSAGVRLLLSSSAVPLLCLTEHAA